jgi:hypothetical protein
MPRNDREEPMAGWHQAGQTCRCQMKPVDRIVTALGRLLGLTQSFMQQTFPFVTTNGGHGRNLNVAQ